jgi:hypothetical protein
VKPIPEEIINQVPGKVIPDRESCEFAADKALMVLFLMGGELDPVPPFPPILSGKVEVSPLPAPWEYEPPLKPSGEIDIQELLDYINGAPATEYRGPQPGLLQHIIENANEYNIALSVNDRPTAERIAGMGPQDSAMAWSTLNSLAQSVTEGSVYSTLQLSGPTKAAYYRAVGLGS